MPRSGTGGGLTAQQFFCASAIATTVTTPARAVASSHPSSSEEGSSMLSDLARNPETPIDGICWSLSPVEITLAAAPISK